MVTEVLVALIEYAGVEDAVVAGYIATAIEVVATVASVANTREQQRRAQNQATDAYNASLTDRYVMSRGAVEPRQMALGRVRVSGPLLFLGSYGANKEHLTIMVALAAHEIDAVETVFFDDFPVTLDGSGNVTGITRKASFSISTATAVFTVSDVFTAGTVTARAVYGTTIVTLGVSWTGTTTMTVTVTGASAGVVGICEIYYQPNPSPYLNQTLGNNADFFSTSATSGAFTLSQAPVTGTVAATITVGTGQDAVMSTATISSVVGLVVNLTGLPGVTCSITIGYQMANSVSKARVRKYLGAAGQTADAASITNFPGIWDSSHTMTGIAYLVVELDYDQTAFPGGIPNVSAQVRGAKCYDPRSSTTAWSDNPALLMRYAATSPLCGNLDPTLINDAAIITAANVCDTSVGYVVGSVTYTRALYKAGMSAKASARAQDVLNDLATAMAGKWAFIDGLLRVHAGAYTTPVLTLDETWLHESQQVHVQPSRARADTINVVTAKFADEQLQYQLAQMPRIAPSTYITADGVELPLEMQFNAIQFTAQAQQVASARLRETRAAMTLSVLCNMKAYPVELFDVLNVTLSRFGWVNKTFEVTEISWTLNGGIQLSMQATDSTVQALGSTFNAFNPALQTQLPNPWNVAPIIGLSAASGTAQLLRQADGSIVSRMLVTWTALTDQAVTQAGTIEVRYGLANTAPTTWTSVIVQGRDAQVYITDVREGWIYAIQARALNALVAGQWCTPITHQVVGKTALPVNVASFIASVVQSGVLFSWAPDVEVDYDNTELRVGASFAAGTRLFKGAATQWTWVNPAVGSYTVWAAHFDTTGNQSATPVNASVSVTSLAGGTVTFTSLGVAGVAGSGQLAYNGDFASQNATPGVPDGYAAYAWGTFPTFTQSLIIGGGAVNGTNAFRITLTSAYVSASAGVTRFGFCPVAGATNAFNNWQQNANYVVSFYARVSANPSSCKFSEAWNFPPGTTDLYLSNPVLTSAWQRYVLLVNWGSGTTEPSGGPYFYLSNGSVGSLPNGAVLDFSCVQIEQGDAPSGFSANNFAAVTGATRPADYASANVSLVAIGGAAFSGNTANSTPALSGSWTTSVYSRDAYANGAFCSCVIANAVGSWMCGLTNNPTNPYYSAINFAWYVTSTSNQLLIYESGTPVGGGTPTVMGTWAIGDTLAVTYDGQYVRYFQNGTLIHFTLALAGLKLQLTVNFYAVGQVVTHLQIGTLTGINIGSLPVQAQGGALNDDPGCTDINAWGLSGSNIPYATVVALTDGAVGGTALQLGPQFAYAASRTIPLTPGKVYRASCYARYISITGGNQFYLRIHCFNASGVQVLPYTLTPSIEAIPITSGWVRYQGILTPAATVTNGFIEIDWNYPNLAGVCQVQDVRLEEVINTDLIAANAATVVTQDVHDFARAVAANGTNLQRSITITPAVACTIQFTASMGANNCCGDSASGIYWAVSAGGGADVTLGADGSTTAFVNGQWPCTNSFAAAAGVALVFKLYSAKAVGITGPTLLVSQMTITEVRR